MIRRSLLTALAAGALLAIALISSPLAQAADVSAAVTWYDTLGYPDVTHLPYVRVATGRWIKSGNKTPENRFVEGFLLGEEPGAFSVFICSVSHFTDHFGMDEPYPSLTIVRFVRKTDGPDYEHVTDEVLDFKTVASEALERVRIHRKSSEPFEGLQWSRPPSHRARIFALARACQQNDLADTASELMDIAAHIPDDQTGKVQPKLLREHLQQDIGEAVLNKAEGDFTNPEISWADHLKVYDHFDTQYPANRRVGYAREAADLLRKMVAEDAAHHPKPLDQMSPAEQVAENIYQLRNLSDVMWIMNSKYPLDARRSDGRKVITPVHRLVDLGNGAVPQLIEALDDRSFTRTAVQSFHGERPPVIMRVADVAQNILQHLSGRNFYARRADDGKRIGPTTRQLAEAWWAEVQGHGEREALIKTTSEGGQQGCQAARKLVEKYPDAALAAIEAGIRASPEKGYRGEFVEVAGTLPGEIPVAFLRSKLAPTDGLYSQVQAAEALFARGLPEAVSAMIQAWHAIQPRLPTDEDDAWSEVGGLITFLAKSGDATAISALEEETQGAPVDVRIAVAEVFLPFPKSADGGGNGRMVSTHAYADMEKLPGGEAGAAIERLLVSALADTARRFGRKGHYNEASYEDPRVCDMAALVLSQRWPEKYPFHWAASAPECDAQITRMRNRWRSEHALPPLPTPAPVVIPTAKESDLAPLLDQFAAAPDAPAREALTTQIANTFGLGALPLTRARLATSKNAAYRPLAMALAGCVREVHVSPDAPDNAAKSTISSLPGQPLTGPRLQKLATELESSLPSDTRAVTLLVERAGDGTGFTVTVDWLPGKMGGQTGWEREQAVRCGDQNLMGQTDYSASDGPAKDGVYRKLGKSFAQAIQSDIDTPIIARLRIQRSKVR